jgi:hypothetical protein
MTYDGDPPRLRMSGSPDDPLVQALEEARLELPSKEQLAAVAARFSPMEGSPADAGAPMSIRRARLRAKSMQAGAVAVALAMGAAATVMMRGHLPFVSAPKVEPQTVPVLPASAPHEKATRQPRHGELNVAPTVEEPKEAPPEVKARSTAPSPSVHREHPSTHETARPSQADLPSSDGDGQRTPEAEAALLGRAHQALAADPSRALALTEEHRRDYPAGLLGQESDLIAIEALAALGRSGEARDRAARFRARYPSSAHLRRIDRLLGDPGTATTPAP